MASQQETPRVSSSTRPLGQLALFLSALLAGYLLAYGGCCPEAQKFLNAAGPIALALACGGTAVRVIAANPFLLLTPLPWFLAACGAFFGVGPLACLFAEDDTLVYMNQLWAVDADGLWQTNVLNTISILMILAAFLATSLLIGGRVPLNPVGHGTAEESDTDVKIALAVFLSIGLPMRYLLVLPHELGQLPFVLPGSIVALQDFVLLGLIALGYLSARQGGYWIVLLVPLLAAELMVAFLQFNKSAILLVLATVPLGRYLAHRRLREILGSAGGCVLVYVLVGSIVAACRNEVLRVESITSNRVSLSERREIAETVLHAWLAGEPQGKDANQGWLSRLCYAQPQAFVMAQYESGSPGDTFNGALDTLVPRFIWKDKPVLTDVGVDFTQLSLGHRYSSTAMGVFAEAYWNGGWLMVVLACGYIGALFAVISHLNVLILLRSDWLLLPCVFWGLKMGFRIDGWFISDYIGSVVLYFAFFGLLALMRLVLSGMRELLSPSAVR